MRKKHNSRFQDLLQSALVRTCADAWREWKAQCARLAEFDRADSAEIARIAGDLGASPAELRELTGRGPHAADLFLRRLGTLNIDREAVDVMVMRDLRRCCSNCATKTLCAHELEDCPKGARWPEYCPNQLTIAALQAGSKGSQPWQ